MDSHSRQSSQPPTPTSMLSSKSRVLFPPRTPMLAKRLALKSEGRLRVKPRVRLTRTQVPSNCSTRSSSRGSTGRFKQGNSQSYGELLAASVGLPTVSAKAWAVSDSHTGKLLYGSHEDDPREIASLTKILTCYTCLKLVKTHPGISLDLHFTVSPKAAGMPGTRAGLCADDEISLRNLLYALMLPSGNDAAVCLAEGIGAILARSSHLDPAQNPPEGVFVKAMNFFAQSLGLTKSLFRNPTGLAPNSNLSTAREVNMLGAAAMRIGFFRTIVRSQEHCISIKGASGVRRELMWLNTNKLLAKGFDGMKTGVTGSAGPCLTATQHSTDPSLIITILHSKCMDTRWPEVLALATWARAQQQCR